jgi:hypothetical protein
MDKVDERGRLKDGSIKVMAPLQYSIFFVRIRIDLLRRLFMK